MDLRNESNVHAVLCDLMDNLAMGGEPFEFSLYNIIWVLWKMADDNDVSPDIIGYANKLDLITDENIQDLLSYSWISYP